MDLEFNKNEDAYLHLIYQLKKRKLKARKGGGDKKIENHK